MTNLDPPRRSCGSCAACCKAFPIEWVHVDRGGKPAHTWCEHASPSRKNLTGACTLHGTDKYPAGCLAYFCGWMAGFGPESDRPDKLRAIISVKEDLTDPTLAATEGRWVEFRLLDGNNLTPRILTLVCAAVNDGYTVEVIGKSVQRRVSPKPGCRLDIIGTPPRVSVEFRPLGVH